jgi:hypothetical protein
MPLSAVRFCAAVELSSRSDQGALLTGRLLGYLCRAPCGRQHGWSPQSLHASEHVLERHWP